MAKSAKPKEQSALESFEKSLKREDNIFVLRLYVTGATSKSSRAIENIRDFLEKHLKDRYELEVIDIYQHPELAGDAQIVAAPTLVKKLPEPIRKLIGDMSDEDRILIGLGIKQEKGKVKEKSSRVKKEDASPKK